ncbi:MAG: aminoacyl-tRNA hydrolase [Phycisphaeraceae bacterium]|nr:aminoacyl-tRNA hydrolase [Phycisphaerales bacterium]MCB9841735.1 aminoacyl-tRNA hydrolase [Phycisphaeraceae bacterium]
MSDGTRDSTDGAGGSGGGGGVELAPGARAPADAVRFSATRSTGPGGQNVNKRSTRVELRISVDAIEMPGDARTRLVRMAGSRLTAEGELILASEEHRSQKRNKDECLERLRELLVRAMVKPKPRKKTKPSKGSKERRLKAKREQSERKSRRQKPGGE